MPFDNKPFLVHTDNVSIRIKFCRVSLVPVHVAFLI